MSNDLNDILKNAGQEPDSNKGIDNQQLVDYLTNNLSQPEQHEMEKIMNDDPFVNDAVEGLQQVKEHKNITAYVEQLNNDLHKQIARNKKRKEKRKLKDSPYSYLIALILLLLLVVCFIVVKKYLDEKKRTQSETHKTILTHHLSNRQFSPNS